MPEGTGKKNLATVNNEGRIVVDNDQFRQVWEDGTTLEEATVQKGDEDGWHLIVQGRLENGNCHSIRTPVDFTPDGEIQLADEGSEKLTQSCTGSPCTRCTFVGGGCACRDVEPSHSCNHSIFMLSGADIPVFLKA